MKYAQMVCETSHNIGDYIQWIAVGHALPRIDTYLDREQLNAIAGQDPVCLVMNGWFMEGQNWPPSDLLRPIFVGFHVTPESREVIAKHRDYLQRYEPIGTRDRGTAEFLNSLGIKTFVTYCMSLTFPTRDKQPANGKVLRVDATGIEIPDSLRRGSMAIGHKVVAMRSATKQQYAHDLIEFYRDNAKLVITTRLHCALPCIAMGIPVLFFGDPDDNRTSIVHEIGGVIYDQKLHKKGVVGKVVGRFDAVDWSPKPLDVSTVKKSLLGAVAKGVAALNEKVAGELAAR